MKNRSKVPNRTTRLRERPLVAAVRQALPYVLGLSFGLATVQPAASRSSESAAAFTANQLVRQFTLKNTVSQVVTGMQGYVAEVNGQQRAPGMGARPVDFPSDMGTIPTGLNLPQRDGAGRLLGYCAWDNSTTITTAAHNAGQGVTNPLVYAVVSPGLNGTMQTTCANLLATGSGVGDDYVQVLAPMRVSSASYKSSVATFADLPAGEQGDIRLVRDTNTLYSFNGVSWQAVSGSGNGGSGAFADDSGTNGTGAISYTTGKVTVADFQAAAATLTGSLSGTTATFSGAVIANTFIGNGNGLTDLNASNFSTGTVSTARGGTGVDASAAGNGTLLIGNGSGFTLGTITAGAGISVLNSAGAITISNNGVVSIAGTANQVIASASNGAVTLSLPQAIATTSTPTFGGMMLNGNLSGVAANFSGAVTANSFSGNGSALTNLNAGNISSGTLPVARGGTGVDGSAAANGQLLIGNGTGYTLGTLTAGAGIGIANGAGTITITNSGVRSLTGTANQVNVSASTGAVTLSLPQAIATTSTPTFGGLTLSGALGGTTATFSGAVTANSFSGNGSALTSLNANNISSGTLAVSRGGTGVDGSVAANGQLLIGNGTGYTLRTLTAGAGIGIANGIGTITITNNGVRSLTGTANQVNVSASTGAVTLSLPQSISTTSTPTFSGLTLNDLLLGTSASFSGSIALSRLDIGSSAGVSNPNTFIGIDTMLNPQTGEGANTAVGRASMRANTSGAYNTALGRNSLRDNTTGYNNTALGSNSMIFTTTGYENTGVGGESLRENITGFRNTAIGQQAMRGNTTGSYNVALGATALVFNVGGSYSVALGHDALYSNTSGTRNTAVGWGTMTNNLTGNMNTALGHEAQVNTGALNYASALGADAIVATNNTLVLGALGANKNSTFSTTDDQVVIGGTSRSGSHKLYVVGSGLFTGTVTQNSDIRLKTNINQLDVESMLTKLGQIGAYSYNYIAHPEVGKKVGVIAQELQNLFPEVANYGSGERYLSVDYGALGAMAAVGVGQLNNKFTVLNKTVTEQGEKLLELGGKVEKHDSRIAVLESWKTDAVARMDGMQTAIDLNIQKIADHAVAIQTNAKAIERLDDALLTLDDKVKGNTDAIGRINERWARNFSASDDGSLLTVNAVELKVGNFSAQQVRSKSVYTERLEAEMARIAELEVNNLRANTAVANTVQAEQMNTGSAQVYAGVGTPALLFAAKADGHYTVSTSALDGSYAAAIVIVNAGQAKVIPISSEGIELMAVGNMVKALAAGKSIKASWTKTG